MAPVVNIVNWIKLPAKRIKFSVKPIKFAVKYVVKGDVFLLEVPEITEFAAELLIAEVVPYIAAKVLSVVEQVFAVAVEAFRAGW